MFIFKLLPLLITFGGIYLLIKLRGLYVLHPTRAARKIKTCVKNKSAVSSLMLALAGTLGVGNIVGVAVGISVGGVGSVFWLLISSVFSAVIKYAEVCLTKSLSSGGDGILGVIEESGGRGGRLLSFIYAALCLLLAFVMGAGLQSHTISATVKAVLDISPTHMIIPLVIVITLIVIGGDKKIEKFSVIFIPLTTIIYIIMCFSIIFANITKMPYAIYNIVKSAFDFRNLGGGALAVIARSGIYEGYARGILSNEAGAGTSSFAHMRGRTEHPAESGLFGVLEVFFDTVILCSVSAITIIVSEANADGTLFGIELVCEAFESFGGRLFGGLLLFCIITFALSTIVCWYYYGSVCYKRLVGRGAGSFYLFVFIFISALSTLADELALVVISDALLFFMSVISLFAVLKNSDRVLRLSEDYGLLENSDSVLGGDTEGG